MSREADPGRVQKFISVLNMSGEAIPAWAAMEPYGVDGSGALLVRKPTVDDSPTALLNGGSVIGKGDYGIGTYHMASWAYYNVADGTPATGESIGTKANSWPLYRGYEGFLVWGGALNSIIQVQRDVTCRNSSSGSYHGGYYPTIGNGYCCGCARFICSGAGSSSAFPASLTCILTVPTMGTLSLTVNKNIGNCGGIPDGFGGFIYKGADYTGGYSTSTTKRNTTYNDCVSGFPLTIVNDTILESITVELLCAIDGVYNYTECIGGGAWYAKVNWIKVVALERLDFQYCGWIPIASCSPFYLTKTKTATCGDSRSGLACPLGFGTGISTPGDQAVFSGSSTIVGASCQVEFHE